MVFSSLYSMVGRNSIMAHCDAELKRGEETISSAQAGIQYFTVFLDARLRGHDGVRILKVILR